MQALGCKSELGDSLPRARVHGEYDGQVFACGKHGIQYQAEHFRVIYVAWAVQGNQRVVLGKAVLLALESAWQQADQRVDHDIPYEVNAFHWNSLSGKVLIAVLRRGE